MMNKANAQLNQDAEGELQWDSQLNCFRTGIRFDDDATLVTDPMVQFMHSASLSAPSLTNGSKPESGSRLTTLRARLRSLVLLAHRAGSRVLATSGRELRDQPIDPTNIDEGQPHARCAVKVSASDGSIQSGEWDCTAGRFRWKYDDDEMIHVLEGQAFIEVDGAMRSIGPGDSVFFPLGQTVRWHVPAYVRKVFFVRHPNKIVQTLGSFNA